MIPPDIVEQVPLDLLGLITGLPADTGRIPWDGPQVRILEHQAHAPGHAALLIDESGVLIAADMLSDVLIPLLDLNDIDQDRRYLQALRDADGLSDPRLGPSATFGDWLPGVHERQLQHLARSRARDGTPG
jgi:glyoxylase-like metal-dependent hydrolase (beta-lactamase superfamily II)